jgi:hypothetical protein
MLKYFIASTIIIGMHSHALAQTASDTAVKSYFTSAKTVRYCPPISQITLNTQARIWSAPGGWKSYDQSFATEINRFLGAQWVGITIGQIACIYQGKAKYTFPILLVYNKLVQRPTENGWKKKENSNRYHCPNNQITECPFYPIVKQLNGENDLQNLHQGDGFS